MARAQYIGVAGVAHRVVNQHIGVDGVARTVKRGYIGVSGVARKFYPMLPEMTFNLVEGDSNMDMDNSFAGISGDKILLKVAASLSNNTGNRACATLTLSDMGARVGDRLSLWYQWEVDINWCDAVLYFIGADGQAIQTVTLPDGYGYSDNPAAEYTIPAGTRTIQIANTLGKAGSGWSVSMWVIKIRIGDEIIF